MGVISRLIRVETITVILNFSCFGSLKYGEEDRKKKQNLKTKAWRSDITKTVLTIKKNEL